MLAQSERGPGGSRGSWEEKGRRILERREEGGGGGRKEEEKSAEAAPEWRRAAVGKAGGAVVIVCWSSRVFFSTLGAPLFAQLGPREPGFEFAVSQEEQGQTAETL